MPAEVPGTSDLFIVLKVKEVTGQTGTVRGTLALCFRRLAVMVGCCVTGVFRSWQ